MKSELKPCPFCGEPAEYDTHRGFINYKGQPDTAVAIYCSQCNCDMCLCRSDYPGDETDTLLNALVECWNKRTAPPPHQKDKERNVKS